MGDLYPSAMLLLGALLVRVTGRKQTITLNCLSYTAIILLYFHNYCSSENLSLIEDRYMEVIFQHGKRVP